MEFKANLQYLSTEQRAIKKGDNVGKIYGLVKLLDLKGNEIFEISIFDNPTLVDKMLHLEAYKNYEFLFKLSKRGYNVNLDIADVVSTAK